LEELDYVIAKLTAGKFVTNITSPIIKA